MSELEQPCPNAKLLIGTWQCPCHGLWNEPKKPKKQPHHSTKEKRSSDGWFVRSDLTPVETEEIRNLYSSGTSRAALRKQFHVSEQRLTRALAGLPRRGVRRVFTDIEIEEMRQLYKEGNALRVLELKFHTSWDKIKAVVSDIIPPGPTPISEKYHDEIRQAHADGESIRSLALRFEKDRRAIYLILGKGEMRVRQDCPSTFMLNDFTYRCHLKTHDKGTHRTKWNNDQFRVEWQ